jgi:hypothetical protein
MTQYKKNPAAAIPPRPKRAGFPRRHGMNPSNETLLKTVSLGIPLSSALQAHPVKQAVAPTCPLKPPLQIS